jgi:dihydropteroate synthase
LGAHTWRFGRRTYLLGVVNVTPDSFSGDGVGASADAALARAVELVAEGADALDIGGESSRPGHQPVSAREELRRVVPAIEAITAAVEVPVFVDTAKSEVARAALTAGAVAVNDIWGLRGDPEMAGVVAAAGAAVVCMHNQGGAEYADLRGEVLEGLSESLGVAAGAGIPAAQVLIDPGFGFGKTPRQSLELLAHLDELRTLARPLLVGTSRKSLVGWLLGNRPVDGRLFGTAATVAWAAAGGADVLRVHDVAEMRDIVDVVDQLVRSERG